MPSSLNIKGLSLFLRGQRILDGISFSVGRGERIALLGQSGSGKTMTARAALGLLPSQASVSGRIDVAGTDVTHVPALSRPKSARPAIVMQDTQSALNPLSTIGYQLEQPLRESGHRPADAKKVSMDLLSRVGMPNPEQITERYPPEISGGQRQRVCIAMAIASEAQIIICDEPTSSLDVVTQAQILKVLRQVTTGPTDPGLLFITHDLHAAAHLCDRAIVIQNGKIVENTSMQQLVKNPRHEHSRALIASARNCGIDCERLNA